MEKAYITGATGAIGMALISKLLSENVEITVFLRKESARNNRLDVFGRAVADGRIHVEYIGLEGLSDYGKRKGGGTAHDGESGGGHGSECGTARDGESGSGCGIARNGESGNGHGSECGGVCGSGAGGGESSVFYHLGWRGTFGQARSDRALQQRNVEYTCDAVRLAARLGCNAFVGAGSQAEYGRVEGALTPDTPTHPENEYGRAKLEAGKQSGRLACQLGINHYWVRILSVYGPYDGTDTMVMSTIRRLIRGQEAGLTQGIQMWDYLYSEDAAVALYLIGRRGITHDIIREAADDVAHQLKQDINENVPTVLAETGKLNGEDGVAGKLEQDANESAPEDKECSFGGEGLSELKIYCLGSGRPRKLRDYIIDICDAVGADRSLLKFGTVPYADGQVMHLAADISRLKEDIGYEPHTEFPEGISKTVEWCRRTDYLG